MATIYTTTTSTSSRAAVMWFKNHKLPLTEINIQKEPDKLTESIIRQFLQASDNGFEDLISHRTKLYRDLKLDNDNYRDSLSTNDLIHIILQYPKLLRYPIIIDNPKILIGYNREDIRTFIPAHERQQAMKKIIGHGYIHNGGLLHTKNPNDTFKIGI